MSQYQHTRLFRPHPERHLPASFPANTELTSSLMTRLYSQGGACTANQPTNVMCQPGYSALKDSRACWEKRCCSQHLHSHHSFVECRGPTTIIQMSSRDPAGSRPCLLHGSLRTSGAEEGFPAPGGLLSSAQVRKTRTSWERAVPTMKHQSAALGPATCQSQIHEL